MAKTLLLADDSVTIQKVVGISFASEDIDITTVDNGHAAVARAKEIVPDVVLADVVMPGMSGYEVCEAIKSDPALAHVPVILLTGTFEAFDAERAERAGAAGHVSKPFEAQTLVDRVKELLAAAPKPMAPPAAPSSSSFEFSDDGSELSAPVGDAEPLDFDESDAAFSFEEDDLAEASDDLRAGPLPDATVLLPTPTPAPPAPPAVPVDERDVAQATLLDPAAARGFDVSSSDLGPPMGGDPVMARLESARRAAAPEVPRPYGARPDLLDESDAMDSASERESGGAMSPAGERESDEAMALAGEPFEAEPMELSDLEPEAEEPGDSWSRPEAEAQESWSRPETPSWTQTEPDDAWSQPGASADDAWSQPGAEAWEGSEAATGDEPQDPGAITDPFPGWGELGVEPEAGSGVEIASAQAKPAGTAEPAALTPALRQELSDTLEKIAWDAFGPVTEKIVQLALERVEQVVWEVVPQLAETLIREEIRRLKDGEANE